MSTRQPDFPTFDPNLVEFMKSLWPHDPQEAGIQEFAQLVYNTCELVDPIVYNSNVSVPDMDAEVLEGNCFARSQMVWTLIHQIVDTYPTLENNGGFNKSGRALYHGGDAVSLGGYPYLELPYGRIKVVDDGENVKYVILARQDAPDPEDQLGAFVVTHDPASYHIFDDPITGIKSMYLIGETRAHEAEGNYLASAQELLQYASFWPQFSLPTLADVAAPLAQELTALYTPGINPADTVEQVTSGIARVISELTSQARDVEPLPGEESLPWDNRQPYIGSMALVEATL